MNNNFELDLKIKEMASRIRELRHIENLSTAVMAEKTLENGEMRYSTAYPTGAERCHETI